MARDTILATVVPTPTPTPENAQQLQLQLMQQQTDLMKQMNDTMKMGLPPGAGTGFGYTITWAHVRMHLVNTFLISLFLTASVLLIQYIHRKKIHGRSKKEMNYLRASDLRLVAIVIPISAIMFFMFQLFTPVTFNQLLGGIGYAVGLSFVVAIKFSDDDNTPDPAADAMFELGKA